MAKKQRSITPKPSKYRGITFRSRLEAKWAIFLDHCPLVYEWSYEPKTFTHPTNGWEYTPDFCFRTGLGYYLLEIKPTMSTTEHLHVMKSFVDDAVLPGNLVLAFGSFYRGEVPKLLQIVSGNPQKSGPLSSVFHEVERGLTAINNYRFDIPWQRQKPKHKAASANMNRFLEGIK